jgi:1,4-dihydroxy-2-naphthoyl-CoA hydrolase
MFIGYNQVRMHDTDMAGRLYFPRQFRFVHDALEDMLDKEGLGFDRLFHQKESFVIVIVHAEADYYSLLRVGDRLEVHVSVEKIGNSSFTMDYQIFKIDQLQLVGSAKTVHVALDMKSQEKITIPPKLRVVLERYVS